MRFTFEVICVLLCIASTVVHGGERIPNIKCHEGDDTFQSPISTRDELGMTMHGFHNLNVTNCYLLEIRGVKDMHRPDIINFHCIGPHKLLVTGIMGTAHITGHVDRDKFHQFELKFGTGSIYSNVNTVRTRLFNRRHHGHWGMDNVTFSGECTDDEWPLFQELSNDVNQKGKVLVNGAMLFGHTLHEKRDSSVH